MVNFFIVIYNPDSAAKIIADEFLQELLERRSTPEFKNIVFSIQKKQGEIIQAAYNRNMVVQGCAGSGKSMIMLHRLPIVLYDNPQSLDRNNLYIITPSQMYIQMAENMRRQLEISDINMGTLEQYYNYCIEKYRATPSDYGRINPSKKLSAEMERYVYSGACVNDIIGYFNSICGAESVSLDKAKKILKIEDKYVPSEDNFSKKISNRALELQRILNANNQVVVSYYKAVRDIGMKLQDFAATLRNRKTGIERAIDRQISDEEQAILNAKNELEKLDKDKNALAVSNRNNLIEAATKKIASLQDEKKNLESDKDYFELLTNLEKKIVEALAPFSQLNKDFEKNTAEEVYAAIDKAGQIIGSYFMIAWETSKLPHKYIEYAGSLTKQIGDYQRYVDALQELKNPYIDFEYYSQIKALRDEMSAIGDNAVKNAYLFIMSKLGIEPNEKGNIAALKCSPYLYLQILYQYNGAPNSYKESLLSIDEAQGVAPQEIKLLSNVNDNKVVFNLFGDERQHIEGSKGINTWSDIEAVLDFDQYDMQENYRNASQITEYCNKTFGMNMLAINTPGKGVYELHTYDEFVNVMIDQLMDSQRAGLAAIIVGNEAEARLVLDKFRNYEGKFHDLTGEDFSLHRTRWNIMTVADAKGLEFSSVFVICGSMTPNERYIACTRALDELFVYSEKIDASNYRRKNDKSKGAEEIAADKVSMQFAEPEKPEHVKKPEHVIIIKHDEAPAKSEVKEFFEDFGLKVVDNRAEGGHLWVMGERSEIEEFIDEAISEFGISGKYTAMKESGFKSGWCTKTDK